MVATAFQSEYAPEATLVVSGRPVFEKYVSSLYGYIPIPMRGYRSTEQRYSEIASSSGRFIVQGEPVSMEAGGIHTYLSGGVNTIFTPIPKPIIHIPDNAVNNAKGPNETKVPNRRDRDGKIIMDLAATFYEDEWLGAFTANASHSFWPQTRWRWSPQSIVAQDFRMTINGRQPRVAGKKDLFSTATTNLTVEVTDADDPAAPWIKNEAMIRWHLPVENLVGTTARPPIWETPGSVTVVWPTDSANQSVLMGEAGPAIKWTDGLAWYKLGDAIDAGGPWFDLAGSRLPLAGALGTLLGVVGDLLPPAEQSASWSWSSAWASDFSSPSKSVRSGDGSRWAATGGFSLRIPREFKNWDGDRYSDYGYEGPIRYATKKPNPLMREWVANFEPRSFPEVPGDLPPGRSGR